MTDQRRLEVPSVGPARCHGSGSYEDGKFYWREGCDDCQRRVAWTREALITPPPIIAFECEYRIGPDEIVAQVSPMTDLTPNDLSHLSDEEFNALCPQGEHAPGPEPLTPAAQAVLDAAIETDFDIDFANLDASIKATINNIAAAAIRALADQVKPTLARTPWLTNEDGYFNETFQNMEALGELNVHYRLLAIATELEELND